MLSFFEMAVVFLVMMTCINGMFFVFGGPVAGMDFSYPAQNDMLITQAEVQNAATTSENSVKEGDAFAAIFSFISVVVGTVTGGIGAISLLIGPFFAFGNAWAFVLEAIFGDTGLVWTFLSLTLIPLINLMQIGSITYLILYAVAAIRGANA